MKNRRFPYGYEMAGGEIVVCPEQAETVKWIFSAYLAGENLKSIASDLTRRRVEYLPGECGWNKSRIKRMIEDRRYIGDETYPPIVGADIYLRANEEKERRRNYTVPTVSAEDRILTGMAVCGVCGGKLFHKTDNTQKRGETWYCKSAGCERGISMTVAALRYEITEILNRLTDEPALAEVMELEHDCEAALEIQRLENEISRQTEALDSDKNEIQELILQCAAKKYDADRGVGHITDRLKADFEKSGPLSAYSGDLLERTVSAVILDRGRPVRLKLKNGKIVGKEAQDYDCTYDGNAENRQGNSAQTGIFGREPY